ncbi:uncharacterized protein LOC100679844 isoform X4 [Nasonia vitripennis]|nr:uncharacterized protein LOC100679844 isoform X4 [Nasonia vitripennis]
MYILFYFAIWYAHKVIKRIEKKNREMLATVERNRSRLDDIIALKNKRAEYEEVVIKAKGDQKITTKQLDLEMRRLSSELVSTMSKLNELEKFLTKWKFWKNCTERSTKKVATFEGEQSEGYEDSENAFEDIKVLEPSFPPPMPPEPPPRKFGVFARPPAVAASSVTNPSTKIGFK